MLTLNSLSVCDEPEVVHRCQWDHCRSNFTENSKKNTTKNTFPQIKITSKNFYCAPHSPGALKLALGTVNGVAKLQLVSENVS
jgi:hypothetical protein